MNSIEVIIKLLAATDVNSRCRRS